MGGSSSTRRITVMSDESSGVIKISDSVAGRLRGEWDTQTEKGTSKVGKGKAPAPTVAKPNVAPTVSATVREPPAIPQPPPAATAAAAASMLGGPPPSSNKPRGKSPAAAEDTKAENYWKEKLRETERRNATVQRETTEQFDAALQEVESLFTPPTCNPICEERKSEVVQCYQTNKTKSLNCSGHVKAFADCVEKMRLDVLITKR